MAQTIKINKVVFGTEVIDTHVYKVTYIDSITGEETMTQPAFVSAGQIRTGKAVIVVRDENVREAKLTCQTGKCFEKTYPVTWQSLSCNFTILLDEPTAVPTPTPTSTLPGVTPSNTPASTPNSTPASTPASTPNSTPASTPASTPGGTPPVTPTPTGTIQPNCDFTVTVS